MEGARILELILNVCKTCSKVWIVIISAEDAKLWWNFSMRVGLRHTLGWELPQPSLHTREGRSGFLTSSVQKIHLPRKYSTVQFLRPKGKPEQKNTGNCQLHALWLYFTFQAGFLWPFTTEAVAMQAQDSLSLCASPESRSFLVCSSSLLRYDMTV